MEPRMLCDPEEPKSEFLAQMERANKTLLDLRAEMRDQNQRLEQISKRLDGLNAKAGRR